MTMTTHKTGTREQWLAARLELLDAEKALTRQSDELAQRRQQLPWVRVDKDYRFDTDEGKASLADLSQGVLAGRRLQLRLQCLHHRRAAAQRRQRIQLPSRRSRDDRDDASAHR